MGNLTIALFYPWVKNFPRSSMKTDGGGFGSHEEEVFLPCPMVLSIEIVKLSKSNLIPFLNGLLAF